MKYKLFSIIILFAAFIFANIKFSDFKYKPININKVFPYKIGAWKGQDIKPDESVYDVLKKDEFLFRKYKNTLNSDSVILSIVSAERRENIHGPSVCYQGQGIKFLEESTIKIDKMNKANFVVGSKNKQKLLAVYWFTDFEQKFTDSVKFSLNVRRRMLWNKPIKSMGLVAINAPDKNKKDIIDFAAQINNILINLKK